MSFARWNTSLALLLGVFSSATLLRLEGETFLIYGDTTEVGRQIHQIHLIDVIKNALASCGLISSAKVFDFIAEILEKANLLISVVTFCVHLCLCACYAIIHEGHRFTQSSMVVSTSRALRMLRFALFHSGPSNEHLLILLFSASLWPEKEFKALLITFNNFLAAFLTRRMLRGGLFKNVTTPSSPRRTLWVMC